jgi:hypothetical protein
VSLDEQLRVLEVKLKQLKLDYEQYFLGTRPRAPLMQRREVEKQILVLSNTLIQNTADRFKFNGLVARFHAFKRQWDASLREIEAGTYRRHVFKANMRDRDRGPRPGASRRAQGQSSADLFETYVSAAEACGQDVRGLTPEKLQAVIRRQESAIRERLGCENVRFRVAVEGGKVKLKATAGEG